MTWKLDHSKAILSTLCWQLQIHLNELAVGMDVLHHRDVSHASQQVFGLETNADHQPRLSEFYQRLDDLIAYYPEDESSKFGLQVDYRLLPQAADHCLELEIWISLQTTMLESYPGISITPGMEANDTSIFVSDFDGQLAKSATSWQDYVRRKSDQQLAAPAVVAGRLAKSPLFAAVVVHPRDQPDLRLDNLHDSHTLCRLNFAAQFMEKGVIRRLRCRLILSTEPISMDDAQTIYQSFANSPLPLTV